ncbi:MAG: flippase-like domain-containing protein [Gemmatimonadetes bacterium]|nr:flippase-like domain-containing protein [Gemmatimonadota bacterium]
MTLLQAHLICGALVAVDLVARALRIRLLTGAIGHPMTFRDAVATNAIGELACAVTPMRLGGEPARLAGLLRAGVPATASFIAVAFEVVTMWPVIIVSALVLGILFAPGWLDATAPGLLRGLLANWGWLAIAGVVSLGIVLVVRRRVHIAPRVTRRPWRRAMVYWRRMPAAPVALAALFAFFNLASRTAILPVLLATLPDPPRFGPALLGSFALLYSQLLLPTPSGVGVVDLGLLAGAAGGVGDDGLGILAWWRFYTTIVGVVVGAWFAVRDFGWGALRNVLRRGRASPTPPH